MALQLVQQQLRSVSVGVGSLLEILLGMGVAAAAMTIFAQVVLRYLSSVPLYWMEELARYLMVWIVLVGTAMGFRSTAHFRLTFILDMLSPGARRISEWILDALNLAFAVVFLFATVPLLSIAADQTSPGIGVSMLSVYLALPIGAGLMTFFLAIRLFSGPHQPTPWECAEQERAESEGIPYVAKVD